MHERGAEVEIELWGLVLVPDGPLKVSVPYSDIHCCLCIQQAAKLKTKQNFTKLSHHPSAKLVKTLLTSGRTEISRH